ncbi:MAG: hypothetical protein B7X53_13230 [Hyphomonas sp. 34-62-18]|nr:hypothetical protein [Hyphomonas sp. 34-62-18]OZB14712.1 MAG: hypothetical protein B7X53_13230 [Hyphomonas sp. 34-62-18]
MQRIKRPQISEAPLKRTAGVTRERRDDSQPKKPGVQQQVQQLVPEVEMPENMARRLETLRFNVAGAVILDRINRLHELMTDAEGIGYGVAEIETVYDAACPDAYGAAPPQNAVLVEDTRRIAAKAMVRMGDKYWPLFELEDEEWTRRQERSGRISACLSEPSAPPPGLSPEETARGLFKLIGSVLAEACVELLEYLLRTGMDDFHQFAAALPNRSGTRR